ncbi:PIH1 domain-containing protein 1-like [Anthonomus grandis grandis]|uniref:PIH1 domain-containing protein 1-like n=1 Tax=Anthonomus grandis grandis TaxID=2921223 RepID=UPI0021668F64|nr:PIH1 domain-containing protein 1-like [Anthonomus grandis grandis]
MSGSKAIFLDVDSSIVENNLRITDNNADELSNIFGGNLEYPSKFVKPHPGLCVKTKELPSNVKIFVNICTTDAIPPPKDITEEELLEILDAEDESPNYRVPMSIGEIRTEKDKKGEDAKVVDIAIHPTFFRKIETNQSFKNFFMAVVFQGLENKYGLNCAEEKLILTNRKCFGTLQTHRIQQREIDEKMGNKSILNELNGPAKSVKIETISSKENATREPEYRLYKKKIGPHCLIGEVKMPDIISPKELTLDIGEDRIVLESQTKGYLLDIFVPYCIRNKSCTASFDKTLKILTIVMPLIGG